MRPDRLCIVVLLAFGLMCAWALAAADVPTRELSSPCGTALGPAEVLRAIELERLGAYRLGDAAGRQLLHVRTAIHIVRTSQGTGGLDEQQLAGAMEKLNQDFAAANLVFVETGSIDYIDSDAFYYEIDTVAEINALRATNPVAGALNIYFTENLASENGEFCGISSFSWQASQGVVMMNACTVTSWNPSTFTHEVGHYFDLFHTHETAFGWECVDGSNCETAGDRLCDTPADPRLNRCGAGGNEYCVSLACEYEEAFVDPCHGDLYDPLTDNMMAFSRPLCRDAFTAQQCAKIEATAINLRADHLIDPAGLPPAGHGEGPYGGMLAGPLPNPVTGTTDFRIALPEAAWTRVSVLDCGGRLAERLLDRRLAAGVHALRWEPGENLPSGVYYLMLSAGGAQESRRFILAR